MKRYGDNLPCSSLDEFEGQSCKDQYMLTGCAVRQDMVGFLMPTAETSNNRKTWNLLSFFQFGRKKTGNKSG